MRFACIIHEYRPFGGLQRDMRGIAEQLLRRSHQVVIATMDWQGEAIDGATIERYPPRGLSHPSRQRRFYAQLGERLAQAKFDCIVGFNRMPGLDVLFNGDDCFAWKMRQRSKLLLLLPRTRHYLAMERAAWGPTADTKLLLVSARQQQHYLTCFPDAASRAHLLPPGAMHAHSTDASRSAQRARLRPLLNTSADERVLLFVASHFHTKGLDFAIKALASASIPLRLWVVGGDDSAPYRRLARHLGVAHQVDFLGARSDVAELMQAADALLHPARTEAAGLVLIEALQAGLAIITSSVCGHAEHVVAAEAGPVVEEHVIERDLPQALAALAAPEQLARWQQNAQCYAQQQNLGGLHEQAAEWLEHWAGARGS